MNTSTILLSNNSKYTETAIPHVDLSHFEFLQNTTHHQIKMFQKYKNPTI